MKGEKSCVDCRCNRGGVGHWSDRHSSGTNNIKKEAAVVFLP
jgi:hypothetical protein